jgi:hypothetical protein
VRTIAAVLTACLLAAGANADVAGDFPASNTPSEYHLTDSTTSIRDLMDKFRHALETKDKQLLRALRVTQDEYLGIIMPGSVEEGQTRGAYSEQAQKYFWGILNGKSIYVEANLLYVYGGKPLKITSVEYRKGIHRYRDYTAYKQLTVTVDDGSGNPPERMRIGSIAEINGQYKFISYVRD